MRRIFLYNFTVSFFLFFCHSVKSSDRLSKPYVMPTISGTVKVELLQKLFVGADISTWLNTIRATSKSKYNYFLGTIRDDTFGGMPAFRVLCITPSEYFRDTSSDWDQFEIITSPSTNSDAKTLWISVDNYKRRGRGLDIESTPSPDWQFSSLADDALTNSHSIDIANALKRAAAGNNRIISITPP